MSNRPLFPIILNSEDVFQLVRHDQKFLNEWEICQRYATVDFGYYGDVNENGVRSLWVRANSQNGFVLSSSTIYSVEKILTKSELDKYVERELVDRAAREIRHEQQLALELLIAERAKSLKEKLCPNQPE